MYTYDAFNRTTKAETASGNIQINHYDAEGLRHEVEENGKLVQFLYSGKEIIVEKTQDDTIRYIRGYGILSSDSEKARTYYHYVSDEASSVTHVMDENSVLNKYEYDAFGNTTSCEEKVHNPFRYRGQQLDSITNQYYLRARYYNPVIGRFTQEDTYHGDGLNLYAYCDNNPVKYYDPSGYSKVDANDNKKALQSLVDEINERGGATADERTILNGWADEYGAPKDSLGLESQKQLPGPTSSSGVEPRAKVPSSEGASSSILGADELAVRDTEFLDSEGNIEWETWAPNGGRVPGTIDEGQTLEVGTVIDRYGSEFGKYTSPEGVPYEQRALPYIENPNAYHRYEVIKPIDNVTMSKIAQAFKQPGGGIQYELPDTIKNLLGEYLKEIK